MGTTRYFTFTKTKTLRMAPKHFVSTIAKFHETKKLASTSLLSESGQTMSGTPIDIKVLNIVCKFTEKIYDNEIVLLCSNKGCVSFEPNH